MRPPAMKTTLRYLLLACGWIALAFGTVGIFLPILPTTPFVLLAAACFLRSSERLHRRLLEHPVLGPPVRNYLAGRGLTRRTKFVAIAMLWASVLGSAFFCVPSLALDLLLIAIAAAVTRYLLRLPTNDVPSGGTVHEEEDA